MTGSVASSSPYVWILANSFTGWLWKDFAREISERTGLKVLLVVSSARDKIFYERQHDEPFEGEIVYRKNPYELAMRKDWTAQDKREIMCKARIIEARFDITLQREIVLADRHLGRGYIPAGAGHPTSRLSQIRTLDSALAACVAVFEQTEKLFDEYPPAVVVSYYGGGGINSKPIALECRHREIPFRAFCPARFGGLAYWAEDEFEGNAALVERLSRPADDLTNAEVEHLMQFVKPSGPSVNKELLRGIHRKTRLPSVFYDIIYQCLSIVYGRWRGYFKRRMGYTMTSTARYMFRAWWHWKVLNRIALRELPDLEGRQIVYFPLQQEPEASTLVLSPNHTNQAATVLELALSLPADAILVVKEHIWQLGRRPASFYQTLLDIPNVKLMHPLASSIDIIMAAELVCTITSSAGYEAAALGRKTVFFWDRSPLRTLPHVTTISGFSNIEQISKLVEPDGEAAAQQRRNDGAYFIRTLQDYCFDVSDLNFFGRRDRLDEKGVGFLVGTLLKTVDLKAGPIRVPEAG